MKPGEPAKDFTLPDQNGAAVTLSALWKQGPVVLFFYPKDDTMGCTAEACAFRDAYDDFKKAGATVIGISSQGQESKQHFVQKNRLNFTLVSDEGGRVRKAYGVKASFLGMVDGRETFVIDTAGTVRHVFNSQVNPTKHVSEALEVLRALHLSPPAGAPATEARRG
jgi:peroxiredoxin Q/BCP